jgi:large subunit ribosomal protein L10
VLRRDKERLVEELAQRLRETNTLIVTDYRGLGVADFEELRGRLLDQGARISVVKNTLTRRAAEAAGVDELLGLLDGPTAIAFIQPQGDPVAVAKILSDTARTTRVLVIKGGLLEGRPVGDADVGELAKLPPLDVLRGQVLGAVVAPLNAIVGLVTAPLQDLYGLVDARLAQLGEQGEAPAANVSPEASAAEEQADQESAVEDTSEEPEPAEVADATHAEREEE